MNIAMELKKIGVGDQDTDANKARTALSKIGYRCIRVNPETWSNGKETWVFTPETSE